MLADCLLGCFWAIGDVSKFSFKNDEPGIRESCHLPTWSSPVRRSPRSRGVLHHPLCRHLREDRHEDGHLRDPSTGDPHQGQRHRLRQRHHVLQGDSIQELMELPHKGCRRYVRCDECRRLQRVRTSSCCDHFEESNSLENPFKKVIIPIFFFSGTCWAQRTWATSCQSESRSLTNSTNFFTRPPSPGEFKSRELR